MDQQRYDAIVVGGGIAGLTAAWRLRHRRTLLLEAEARPGGRMHSLPRGSLWLNLGAHLFGSDISPAGRLANEFAMPLGDIPGDRLGIALNGKVVAGGYSETFPLRLPLSLADRVSFTRMGLKLRSGVSDLLAVQAPVAGEAPAARRERQIGFDNGRTLAERVGPLTPEVATILRTVTERTGSSPEGMAAGYGLTSFAQVWSKHSFGRNLVGGTARLPFAIAERLPSVRLSARVVSVEAGPDGVTVAWDEGGVRHEARAAQVILATPADITRAITKSLPEETDAALGAIRYGPFLSVAVLTREDGPMPYDNNYAIATPHLAFGVLFNMASTLRTGPRTPGGSLMLFRGGPAAAALLEKSDDEITGPMQRDLERLFPETRGIVSEMVVQRWPRGAPYAFVGRAGIQPALTRPLGRLHLAGDYLEFPCMDAAIATAEEAAERVDAALGAEGPSQALHQSHAENAFPV
ncbi:protoporphyrinogen/coproporphyrinogen oxidase [Acuticoccus kandeliae]|uniref:protoporphyrinogen/coproporphyrinogen oxidase n=1 Tax=Acuticoccus kandeliae TaxID=2073160 RepID=UPI000D3E8BB2|nr:FAD-dependent oxidoreductase [Acuticoccus kandeliae]